MDKSVIQKIKHDFDRIALYEQPKWNHNNHYHQFLLKQLPSHCENVLDIGCGTGEFSRLLAKQTQKVVVIDLSPKTIEIALANSQEYKNINFQIANILNYEFPREYFDAIVSIATLHHVPEPELLANLKASLKPGGTLAILDLLKHENLQDSSSDIIAVPLNWIFSLTKNGRIKQSPEAIKAMKEHLHTDEYLTLSQVKQIYTSYFKGAKITKHLFWRYSVIWQKTSL
ncbi:Type 11 methyltransferase [Hyella patelloides LEGE 07179]|uniref:Type 11 methyltransferase n=1 Tax=Hyella patelloides LEGE 07179 TaxID=945734 RepID=A0A563VJS6_9CYAN|nr:class I SAM-dependent methyltransferase [Hyella patelloides]VEP11555.1 Type 11 methyltransferase [Hyella patelloides LEGE 07179]